MTGQKGTLSGRAFLVIEDDALQAQLIGDLLDSMGGTVSKMAHTYEQARTAVDEVLFDCAILDINLGGTLSFPVAELLASRRMPFVVCTGYGAAVAVHQSTARTPRLDKPVGREELLGAVLAALSPRRRRQRLGECLADPPKN